MYFSACRAPGDTMDPKGSEHSLIYNRFKFCRYYIYTAEKRII